jgi:hypothetical protein
MAEPLTGTLPPPLPPRNRTVPPALPPRPPALPPRPLVTDTLQSRPTIASDSSVEAPVALHLHQNFDSTGPDTPSTQQLIAINSNTPVRRTASASVILSDNATPSASPSTEGNAQSSPKLASLVLSYILWEPLERSYGHISTITVVQSFFQSNLPAPPPFEYSTLVDYALLASQIALHDPHMRQQKRLPLVLSLSIGAFLVAASGIISRYFGWTLLAAATWLGPARFVLKEMWYISVGLIILNFFVDIFPMLSLCTLLWIGVICVSRVIDGSRNSQRERTVPQFMQNTAKTFQDGNSPKHIALEMVQNITAWWTYRQSEPERLRRVEEKAAKKASEEEKKLNKLRRAETLREQKQAEMDQKVAEKSRNLEEQKGLKQMKVEKNAEKQRRKDEDIRRKRLEREKFESEKQYEKEGSLALKRANSEAKERAKQLRKKEEVDLKRVTMLEKEEKRPKVTEEKEGQTKENEELDITQRIFDEDGNTLLPDISRCETSGSRLNSNPALHQRDDS